MSKKEHEARFTSATSFRQEEEEEWKTSEASDWDDPLQTALLYKDWHSSTCGHAIPWNASRLVDLKRCPICHESVSLICDGGQPQFQFRSQSNDGSSSTHPFVLFKFGKQTYRLSLQRPNPTVLAYERSSPIKTKTTQLAAFLNQWTMWSSPQSSTIATATATATATPCTAQERIQTALQLGDGFKILHKGKVLLPSNSVHHQTAEAISDQLADVSMKDEGDSGVRRTKIAKAGSGSGSGSGGGGGGTPPTPATTTKVSLVLMGTLQGRELQEPSSSAVASSLYSFTWIQLLQLPLAIFFWSLHSTWIFAKSFLEPFLPSSLIVGRGREDQQAPMDDLHRD